MIHVRDQNRREIAIRKKTQLEDGLADTACCPCHLIFSGSGGVARIAVEGSEASKRNCRESREYAAGRSIGE